MSGWLDNSTGEYWGRPVATTVDGSGNLLISDRLERDYFSRTKFWSGGKERFMTCRVEGDTDQKHDSDMGLVWLTLNLLRQHLGIGSGRISQIVDRDVLKLACLSDVCI